MSDEKPFSPGLAGVIGAETAIGFVDGANGKLLYRGYPIEELARSSDFEEVCYLLLNGQLPNVGEKDEFVSFLPLAWIGEQMMSISCGIQAGFTLNFPEEPETSQEDLREIGPQMMFSSARLYEQMVRGVQVKYEDTEASTSETTGF